MTPRARSRSKRRGPTQQRAGVALVLVLVVIAILTVFVTELLEGTSTALHVAASERDRLKAEYIAKSGLNLTRLLIAREPDIRKTVAPLYQMLTGRPPPQLNVWDFANELLAPFRDLEGAKSATADTGIDFSVMEGVVDTGGTFDVITIPENSMINVNNPLFLAGDAARTSIAMQLFALMGGVQSPNSPYDQMFASRDADGQYTTRLDIVSDMIDWWDFDEQRTVFDPGSQTITVAGSEDDIYSRFRDPYLVKNAPLDSLEELRLLRGVGDDFWATFVQSDPEDPRSRKLTIYGSGSVNVNLAPPEVLLARLCSYVPEQVLCQDPQQVMSFMALFSTARSMLPISLFTSPADFVNFVSGKGNGGRDLYPMLQAMLGPDNLLMAWTPVNIPEDKRKEIERAFIPSAAIFTIQSTGTVGRARTRVSAVVNFHDRWTPPPPNTGGVPPLGVVHHYRVD